MASRRVEDAGGAQSQVKIDLARTHGPETDAAREWLTRYNESDVAAQAAIRDGLRTTPRQWISRAALTGPQ